MNNDECVTEIKMFLSKNPPASVKIVLLILLGSIESGDDSQLASYLIKFAEQQTKILQDKIRLSHLN